MGYFLKYHVIRKLTNNNTHGDCYGITIPSNIAENLVGEKYRIELGSNYIKLVRSGCNI